LDIFEPERRHPIKVPLGDGGVLLGSCRADYRCIVRRSWGL
jgi:hypothetical protein